MQRSLFESHVVGHDLDDIRWSIAQLPFDLGGFGFIPADVLSICGYLASLHASKAQILARYPNAADWFDAQYQKVIVLFNNLTLSAKPFVLTPTTRQRDLVRHVMQFRYDQLVAKVSPDLKNVLFCESRTHASAWKSAPATPEFITDPMDFQINVRRSLRVPLFDCAIPCVCGAVIDAFGDHCLHCKPGGGLVHRHDDGFRLFVKLARESHKAVEVENTKTLPARNTYRPDFVFLDPVPGVTTRKGAFDFTVTNSFAPYISERSSKVPGHGIEAGEKRKYRETDVKGLNAHGYDFVPLSFESHGGFDSKTELLALYLLSEKALIQNRSLSEVTAEFWQRLSITIHRSNAHMVRDRLSLPGAVYPRSRRAAVVSSAYV
jgi:hypothetical protein